MDPVRRHDDILDGANGSSGSLFLMEASASSLWLAVTGSESVWRASFARWGTDRARSLST